MKSEQNQKLKGRFIIESVFIILLCEKIYNHSYISGTYNAQVTLGFALFSMLLLVSKSCNLIKRDMVSLMFILIMTAYGFSKETLRYSLTFFHC